MDEKVEIEFDFSKKKIIKTEEDQHAKENRQLKQRVQELEEKVEKMNKKTNETKNKQATLL